MGSKSDRQQRAGAQRFAAALDKAVLDKFNAGRKQDESVLHSLAWL